jgi:hypothetical protein
MLMALNALAIDIMLPALPQMGRDFAVPQENDRQMIIVSYMLGFGVSQLFYGPLTDRFGRRSVLFVSLFFYIVAAIMCVYAPTFELLIWARLHGRQRRRLARHRRLGRARPLCWPADGEGDVAGHDRVHVGADRRAVLRPADAEGDDMARHLLGARIFGVVMFLLGAAPPAGDAAEGTPRSAQHADHVPQLLEGHQARARRWATPSPPASCSAA